VESEAGEVIEVAGAVQDITERKVAERELREREARLRGLANSIPGVVYQSGPSADGGRGMRFVGEAADEVLGLPAETSHFRERFLECIPASHREDLLSSLDAATDAGSPWRFEVPFDRPDGNRIWILGTATPTQQEGALLYNGVLLDITERKESRRALEHYRVYTGRLLDAIDDLFFVIDEEAQLQRWNDRFLEVTGYTDAEMEHRTAFDFVPEDERDRLAATIASGFTSGTAQIGVPLVGKDGTTTPYEFIGNLVQHPDGGLRAVGIGRDITERRRRKRQLERQNDLFSKAQTIADVGGWEYDLGAEEGTLTDQAHRIYGRSPEEEMTLEGCFLSYHTDDRPEIRRAFTQAVEAGRPYDLELRLITEQGEQRWVRTRGEPQREDGTVVRVRGTIQDVTEQVERRKELEEAKEAAEEADRIKAALLSNMNHELRTPLTSILTFSKLIHDNPDVADQFIDRIQGGGERLLYTLNTVMDFAELEAGDRALAARPFQLSEVVRSVVNDVRERARRKGLALSVDGPDETASVVLDQYRLERILIHLVHNAVKFTEDGQVTVAAEAGKDDVVVRVEDTGVGIAPAFQPRVFDEFAQESSGYDRTHEGNGLGLTVAKRLVDEMDGRIELESEPGDGTRVIVRVPSSGKKGGGLGAHR
jgi:PAS domain S-box-containing protein